MLDNVFRGLFDSSYINVISVSDFLLCIGCSLIMGLILTCAYMYRTRYSRGFVATLAMLPAVVCVVIMMVNGNIGAGVAVAGTFSLTRFRSIPGTAKEIGALFLAMGGGLIAGMGYLAYALLFILLLSAIMMLYARLDFGAGKNSRLHKTLHITIPEDLDYTNVFEDIFPAYLTEWELIQVHTSNMGSLFRLTYNLTLRTAAMEKELIDKLRCRNGNLEISISRQETTQANL